MARARLIAHRLWLGLGYTLAGLLILVAVLITLARLLPVFDGYRSHVEQLAAEALGRPVLLGGMELSLSGWHGIVALRNLELMDQDGQQPVLRFERVRITVDLIASLRHRRLETRDLTVYGTHLTVTRHADGRFDLAGFTPATRHRADDATTHPTEAGNWLLAHHRLRLQRALVTVRDEYEPERYWPRLELSQLLLLRSGGEHRFEGRIAPPPDWGDEITVVGRLHGLRSDAPWQGELYLQGEQLHLPPLLALLPDGWLGAPVETGQLDLQAWIDFGAHGIDDVLGEVRLSLPPTLSRLSGRLQWQRDRDGWQLAGQQLTLEGAHGPLAPMQLAVRADGDGLHATLDRLALRPLLALSQITPLTATQRETLLALAPRGTLDHLTVQWRPQTVVGERLRLQGRLHGLGWRPHEKIPGVDHLDGLLQIGERHGRLHLASIDTQLQLPHLFRAPLHFDTVDGRLDWHFDSERLTLSARDVQVSNPDARGSGSMELSVPFDDATPIISLEAEFHDSVAARVSHYLPVGVMPPETVHWLDHAFSVGQQSGPGRLTLQGPLRDFPFNHGEGVFEVRFRATGMALDYMPGWRDAGPFPAPGWPALHDVDGLVVFHGPGLTITSEQGRLLESRIRSARVAIEDLENPLLSIRGEVEGPVADVVRVLRDGPPGEQLGAHLAELEVAGQSRLHLTLAIPLAQRIAVEQPLSVEASLDLADNQLALRQGGVAIDGIDGRLHYREQRLTSEDLHIRLLGGRSRLSLVGETEGEQAGLTIRGRGAVNGEALAAHLGLETHPVLRGNTSWEGRLRIPASGEPLLEAHSDLRGLTVDLPAPFAKVADSERLFHLRVSLGAFPDRTVRLRYADLVQAVLELHEAEGGPRLKRGGIRFGGDLAALPEGRELRLSGTLDGLATRGWTSLLPAPTPATAPDTAPTERPLPILLTMERLQLVTTPGDGDTAPPPRAAADPRRAPAVNLHIDDLRLNEGRLGRLTVEAEPISSGLALPTLRLESDALTLEGHGSWDISREGSRTRLVLALDSSDLGAALRHWGHPDMIDGGRGRIDGELAWPGGPHQFIPSELDGELHVSLRDGQLLELRQGIGRFLGLFSLQMLPRRLALDFRDLFARGFHFQRISGDFRLDDGDAHTENLAIEGSGARLYVAGRTGLAARDYDQVVAVLPDVAGPIPMAGGLILGPQAGALLSVLRFVFRDQLAEAAKLTYHISGSWDAPVIQRVSD